MWEFCLATKRLNVAKFIYQTLKKETGEFGSVLTCYEEFDNFFIMLACSLLERTRMTNILERCIIKVICNFYKEEFLDKNLHIPTHEKMSLTAFKKALINFDKETDFYIISKNLHLDKTLFLDAFYDFRLSALRDKWNELVMLANDNSDYLIGDEAFFDLLKFLIDNLEIGENEISVFEKENGYTIKLPDRSDMFCESLTNEGLISTLIELSPKKINLYCNREDATANFLSKIFEKRINVCYNKNIEKVDNFGAFK